MKNREKFRNNLQRIRMAHGLTASELAKKAKLKSVKRMSDLERKGDTGAIPSISELQSICEVLNVSIEGILNQEVVIEIKFSELPF